MEKTDIKSTAKTRCLKYQYFASFVANIITFSYGAGVGWLSPALPLLRSQNSPLESGELTVEEISWIGSVLSLGAICGNLFCGFLVPRIGAKLCIMLIGIPQLSSWLLIFFGTHVTHLEISRFLMGLTGGGAQCSLSIYVAEIADKNVRGKMTTIYQILWRLGVLFAYVVVSYLDYSTLAICFVAITVPFYAIFTFLPSTPQHLLKTNQIERAEKSMQFYKGFQNRKESQTYISEIGHLKSFSEALKEEPKIQWKNLLEARIAIIQAVAITLLNILSGVYPMLTYGSTIIEKTKTNVSTESANVIFGLTQFGATILAGELIDRKGRKFLLFASMVGCALGNGVLSAYLQLYDYGFDVEMFNWLPVVCMSCVILSASLGIGPLTLISLVESFPAKLRPIGVTFGAITLNIFTFIVAKLFPILLELIQLQGCMLIFSISCGFGVIYLALFVKETKGKDLNMVKSQDENKSSVKA